MVGILRDQLEGSIFADLFGEPAMVADALERLGAAGVGRITIGAVTPDTYELLAPALVAT